MYCDWRNTYSAQRDHIMPQVVTFKSFKKTVEIYEHTRPKGGHFARGGCKWRFDCIIIV